MYNNFSLHSLNDNDCVKDLDEIGEWQEEDVIKMGFDGRQVRSIVTGALGLAGAQNERLEKSHFKILLNSVKDLKDEFIKQFDAYKTEQHMGK